MKKRLFALFSVCVMLFSLSACSLARPEDETANKGEDRLIGVFVTTEYLDLFDFEGYFNDHANELVGGGDVVVEDTAGYEGRIYATLESVTDYGEDGESFEHKEFVFENLEGYSCFTAYIPDGENGYVSINTEGFSDLHTHYSEGDDSSGIELEGTLYICPQEEACYYFNPVYQTADNAVYVTSGQGFMTNGMESEGGLYSHAMEQTSTTTREGEREEYSAKVTCHLEVRYPTLELAVLEMNEAGEVVARHSFIPGQFPDGLELSEDCAWLIAEHHKMDYEGQSVVSRTLVERGESTISTYYLKEGDRVLTGDDLNLLWPEP